MSKSLEQVIRDKYTDLVVDQVLNRVNNTSYSEAYGYYEDRGDSKRLSILELLQSCNNEQ